MKPLFVAFLLIGAWLFAEESPDKISEKNRDQNLRRAQVWKPVDVSKMDVLAGPQNEISVPPLAEVSCTYIEPKEKPSGAAKKFLCKTAKGQTVRVKYGKESKEIFAEVAASRLFWALGFYADEYYPVKLKCLRCPEIDPSNPTPEEKRVDPLLEFAIIERKFAGISIEEQPDQGWKWSELDDVSAAEGGAPREQIDAFKLLAVFVQHSDAPARNQRLACYNEDLDKPDKTGAGRCRRPVLMIQDFGTTFGSGVDVLHVSKMSFTDWSEREVWDRKAEAEYTLRHSQPACIGELTPSRAAGEDGLSDPAISEGGRKLLADLLNQLSKEQILNIFRVAGVDRRDEVVEKDDVKKRVTAKIGRPCLLRNARKSTRRIARVLPYNSRMIRKCSILVFFFVATLFAADLVPYGIDKRPMPEGKDLEKTGSLESRGISTGSSAERYEISSESRFECDL